jgi:hypothetical protein
MSYGTARRALARTALSYPTKFLHAQLNTLGVAVPPGASRMRLAWLLAYALLPV